MPFTDADGNPITCHTCPFKINTDCTAMPPTPSTNALTMQVWNYPPARNPCIRHPALGGFRLPEGVTAVLDLDGATVLKNVSGDSLTITTVGDVAEAVQNGGLIAVADDAQSAEPEPTADEPAKPLTRTRASRATARPAE